MLSWNIFTCKGTYMTDWVGRHRSVVIRVPSSWPPKKKKQRIHVHTWRRPIVPLRFVCIKRGHGGNMICKDTTQHDMSRHDSAIRIFGISITVLNKLLILTGHAGVGGGGSCIDVLQFVAVFRWRIGWEQISSDDSTSEQGIYWRSLKVLRLLKAWEKVSFEDSFVRKS